MHEFAAQSFDEYEINLRIETVDKEFDYRKIVSLFTTIMVFFKNLN